MTIPNIHSGVSGKIKIISQNDVDAVKLMKGEDVDTSETAEYVNSQLSDDSELTLRERFRSNFDRILHDEVLDEIAPYEKERKLRFSGALVCAIIFSVLGVISFLFLDENIDHDGMITWGCFALAGGIWFAIKKSFEKKIKLKIMPKLMKAFDGFDWSHEQMISTDEIDNIKLFNNSKNMGKRFDDAFYGKYRDVDINIAECEYSVGSLNNKQTVFNGAVIRLKMNKTFEGITIVRPKKHNCKDLEKNKLQKVELEDVDLMKRYKVFSTDQIESRYLLTTGFIERFKNISFAFNAKDMYCVFYNKYVYIAPCVKGDLFALFSLRKPVNDTAQFELMFNQIQSILDLVDYFKLDKKLGL